MSQRYRPGEAAESLKAMTRAALLATQALQQIGNGQTTSRVERMARSTDAAGSAAEKFTKHATNLAHSAEAMAAAVVGVKELKTDLATSAKLAGKIAEHAASSAITTRFKIPTAPTGLAAGVTAINLGADKAATVALNTIKRIVGGGLHSAAALFRIPISVASIAMKIGLGIAEGLLLAKIKQWTGMSTIKLLLIYAGVKVTLKIVEKLIRSSVAAMTRVATIPFRIGLSALKATANAAVRIVKSAAREAASVAAAPVRALQSVASLGGGGLGLAGLIGTPAAIAGAIKLASDLEETTSKVQFAFGKAASVVVAGADAMSKRFGIARTDFMEGAAAIGLIGKAAELTDSQAASMGTTFAKLAADFASLHNITFDESLEKIRAGLVGEAEPLRPLGILLSENATKAKAFAMGFQEVNGQLSEGAKIQARAAIILAQSSVAQGDLARTAESLANRLRELWGRAKNLAAELGGVLLPAAKSLAGTLAEMATDAATRLEGARSITAGWASTLKAAADQVGVIYRNWADFSKLAGGAIKAGLDYGLKWAKYFANVLGQSVEKAIQDALANALGSNSLTSRFAPAKYQQRVSFMPPAWQAPPGLGEAAGGIKAFETGRALAGAAMRAKEALTGLAQQGLGLLTSKAAEATKRTEAETQARAASAKFADEQEAKLNRYLRDQRLPKGFMTKSEKAAAALTAGLNPAGIGAAVAGMLGGAVGGIGAGPAGVLSGLLGATAGATSAARLAGYAEKGSVEAYSAIVRHGMGGGEKTQQTTARNTGEAVAQLKQLNNTLQRALKGQGGKPLAAFTF